MWVVTKTFAHILPGAEFILLTDYIPLVHLDEVGGLEAAIDGPPQQAQLQASVPQYWPVLCDVVG